MKTAAYLRVSSDDQTVDSQRREVERWLVGNGVTEVEWYIDVFTGTRMDRPEFERLQRDVFNGEVKTIVVYKLDRVSRSLRDGINVLCDWLNQNVRVVSVTQQLDFAGPTGKLIAATLFAVAELERETLRERQRAGIEAAKLKGAYLGRAKGTTKAKPERARLLRAKGLSYEEIATALGVHRTTVQRYVNARALEVA
jgi:DNA invertase Pin-like site-specific DNA recombinase